MVFPQVPKDPPRDVHQRRSQINMPPHHTPPVIVSPLVVQQYAQNVHTEVQFGLAPPSGGGFFASGLFRTRQIPRPRAFSMLPLTSSQSQEEVYQDKKAQILASNPKKSSNRSYKQRYYPLSQEDTFELLFLFNQVFIASDADIVRRMATATRGACPPPLRRPSRSICEAFSVMAPINCNRSSSIPSRRYSTLVSISERVVLRTG